MSEQKTRQAMILHGFLLGLTATSTAVYGCALGSHWAKGLRSSGLDEIVFILTVLATAFYAQAFTSSYAAYQRLHANSLPLTMPTSTSYVPPVVVTAGGSVGMGSPSLAGASPKSSGSPFLGFGIGGGDGARTPVTTSSSAWNEKHRSAAHAGGSSPASSPARSTGSSASPASTIIGTPALLGPEDVHYHPQHQSHASPSPNGLRLPALFGKDSRSSSPSPLPSSKPNGTHNRRSSNSPSVPSERYPVRGLFGSESEVVLANEGLFGLGMGEIAVGGAAAAADDAAAAAGRGRTGADGLQLRG